MIAMEMNQQHPPQTRQQGFLRAAAAHVQAIKDEEQGYQDWHIYKDTYGSLCHKLPVLIMTNGLAQTVAFIEAKAKDGQSGPAPAKPRERAYWRLREHLAATLGDPQGGVAQHILVAPTGRYIHATRTILAAWVYYKRFAESILDARADSDPGDGRGEVGS